VSIGALGRIQPPIHWVPGDLSLGVQQTGREVDHSPPSSVEIKNVWICTSTLAVRLHGVVLRGNFTFTLLYFTFSLPFDSLHSYLNEAARKRNSFSVFLF